MKNKIVNYIIYLLIFLIFVVGGIILYLTFFIETHNVSFISNGVDFIAETDISCTKSLRGCYVILPNILRSNGEVLGYNLNSNDEEAKYKVGEKFYIKDDITLYAISYQTFNVHIDNNDVDYLEKNDISCNAYNTNKECKVTFPNFNKIGYQNAGYSQEKDLNVKIASEYYPQIEAEINKSFTVYPRYTNFRDNGIYRVYSNNNVYSINGSFVEFDESLSQSTIDTYKKFLQEISEKAPFLFVGEKINILNSTTFQKTWSGILGNSKVLGICYGSSTMGHPLSRTIDVFWYSKYNEDENYRTLVHEMSHAFDMYYGYAVNNQVPDVMDASDVDKMRGLTFDEQLDKIYGTERISAQKDILVLYMKYKKSSNRPVDNNGYAYTKNLEFVAEAFSWYYMKYLILSSTYKDTDFPDELKNTIEKYICVAQNNYGTCNK